MRDETKDKFITSLVIPGCRVIRIPGAHAGNDWRWKMTAAIVIVCIFGVGFLLFMVWSMCAVAGKADERMGLDE